MNIRAAGVAWIEVPTLYGQQPTAQVFTTLNQPGGATTVLFGDSAEGATLPTGQGNLIAAYRIGSGSSGNIAAQTLTTLMDRPLGVSAVTNPAAATGGQDAATLADLQSNAPQTVLTLGRAVSLADYQNFAANFSGISKAYAIWIPAGVGRGVFLTVAGTNGLAVPPSCPTMQYLSSALATYAPPHIPITIVTFLETLFYVDADIAYDPAYDASAVETQIRQTLQTTYSFAQRSFGQGVSSDEVATVIQAIPGVLGVNVNRIGIPSAANTVATSNAGDILSQPGGLNAANWNAWTAGYVATPSRNVSTQTQLAAWLPVPNLTTLPQAAEILVLSPDPTFLILGVMA